MSEWKEGTVYFIKLLKTHYLLICLITKKQYMLLWHKDKYVIGVMHPTIVSKDSFYEKDKTIELVMMLNIIMHRGTQWLLFICLLLS